MESLKLGLTSLRNNRSILNHQLLNTLGMNQENKGEQEIQIIPDATIADKAYAKDGEAYWQTASTMNSPLLEQSSNAIRKMKDVKIDFYDLGLTEIVVMPTSNFAGLRIGEANLRKRFGINVLGVKRGGGSSSSEAGRGGNEYITDNLIAAKLHVGDMLLVQGEWTNLAHLTAEVLKEKDLNPVREELEQIVPMKAAFDKNYAKRLDGDNVKDCKTRWEMVEVLRQDIRDFKEKNGCSRIVVAWAASTEIYVPVDMEIHGTLAALEAAMKADDRQHIAPSMCYAYAALTEGAPFIMGAPNTTVDIPAMWELAEKTQMPIAGKDFKTGQTLVKSGFAPIIGTRCLGLNGWFSTNILGNRDGLVLDEPANFHTKEVSKLSTLETILKPEEHQKKPFLSYLITFIISKLLSLNAEYMQ